MNKILQVLKTFYDYYRSSLNFSSNSYAVKGEDILIGKVFKDKNDGFFLDIGAHHPFRFSNTFLLYEKGWKGLNIDPKPGTKAIFKKFRPKDITYEVAISKVAGEVDLYTNKLGALNTISKTRYEEKKEDFSSVIKVSSMNLSEILSIEKVKKIDFLSIDTEGSDLEIIKLIDIKKLSPYLICIEDLNFDLEKPNSSETYQYLVSQGYRFYAFIPKTLFFTKRD